jgi:hypothetical protein
VSKDDEIAALFAELRNAAESSQAEREVDEQALADARDEAIRFWPVSAERDFLSRPGRSGRVRGALLVPVKKLLRPMMRWYVEPALADQRRFNAAVLRMLDELARENRRPAKPETRD